MLTSTTKQQIKSIATVNQLIGRTWPLIA